MLYNFLRRRIYIYICIEVAYHELFFSLNSMLVLECFVAHYGSMIQRHDLGRTRQCLSIMHLPVTMTSIFAPRQSFSLLQSTRTCTQTISPGQVDWSRCCLIADPWYRAVAVPRRTYSWSHTIMSNLADISWKCCLHQVTPKVRFSFFFKQPTYLYRFLKNLYRISGDLITLKILE